MYWPDEILRSVFEYIPSRLDRIKRKYPYCLNINCDQKLVFHEYKSIIDFHMAKCDKCNSGIYICNNIKLF